MKSSVAQICILLTSKVRNSSPELDINSINSFYFGICYGSGMMHHCYVSKR